jgi:hypothetical protein
VFSAKRSSWLTVFVERRGRAVLRASRWANVFPGPQEGLRDERDDRNASRGDLSLWRHGPQPDNRACGVRKEAERAGEWRPGPCFLTRAAATDEVARLGCGVTSRSIARRPLFGQFSRLPL